MDLKENVPYGEWENWIQKGALEATFSTVKHAQKYMRLAKNKELAKGSVGRPFSLLNVSVELSFLPITPMRG